MSTAQRVAKLEEAAGLGGTGCPQCRHLPPVVRLTGAPRVGADREPEPPEGAGVCPHCGHDRTVSIEIVLVTPELPQYAPLEARRDE